MTRYLVIVSQEIEADDPHDARAKVVQQINQYQMRVWTVPLGLDGDPELVVVEPPETEGGA